jgi:arylsulfatase
MSIDEPFDIGSDTRTAVDDSYTLPFRFTGTINKLTYHLGQEQISADERSIAEKALAVAHD